MVGTFKMKKNEMIFFNCVRNGPPFVKPKLAPGLCNRLRGMFTIYTYSKIADIPFGFSWHPESTCNCNFQDIFQVPTEFNHLDSLNDVEDRKLKLYRYFETPDKFYYSDVADKYDISLNEFLALYKNNLKLLKPTKDIMNKISKYAEKYEIKNKVGVHIRKTDHAKSRGGREFVHRTLNSHDWFERKISEELQKNPNSSFFLATDNKESQEHLKKVFGERIVSFTSKTSFDNNQRRHTDMSDAVCDLWLLSMCRKILGSCWSSYNEFASDYGDCQLISPDREK